MNTNIELLEFWIGVSVRQVWAVQKRGVSWLEVRLADCLSSWHQFQELEIFVTMIQMLPKVYLQSLIQMRIHLKKCNKTVSGRISSTTNWINHIKKVTYLLDYGILFTDLIIIIFRHTVNFILSTRTEAKSRFFKSCLPNNYHDCQHFFKRI